MANKRDPVPLVDPAQAPRKGNPPKGVDYNKVAAERARQGLADVEGLSLDKHSEKLRYKIAYSAHKLADELAVTLSSKTKKDKEYVKGLVWSLGVLYDKLKDASTGEVAVRIPAKLLENVKAVITVQLEKRAALNPRILDVPPTALDTQSSAAPVESTG